MPPLRNMRSGKRSIAARCAESRSSMAFAQSADIRKNNRKSVDLTAASGMRLFFLWLAPILGTNVLPHTFSSDENRTDSDDRLCLVQICGIGGRFIEPIRRFCLPGLFRLLWRGSPKESLRDRFPAGGPRARRAPSDFGIGRIQTASCRKSRAPGRETGFLRVSRTRIINAIRPHEQFEERFRLLSALMRKVRKE